MKKEELIDYQNKVQKVINKEITQIRSEINFIYKPTEHNQKCLFANVHLNKVLEKLKLKNTSPGYIRS